MKKNKILKEFLLFTVLPFLIPLFNEIDDTLINPCLKWIIILLVAIIDFYFAYKTLKEKESEAKEFYLQKSIRQAFSGAHEIAENKRDVLSHEIEFNKIDIKGNILPYDIHAHIGNICKEFRKVISAITQISNEFISVTFIYHYIYKGCDECDREWKWIAGREPLGKNKLGDLIKREDSLFYQIINGEKHYIFGNSKVELAEQNLYYLSERDHMYNNVGSVFSIKVVFGDNVEAFVEGVITVTTHGKHFTDNITIENPTDSLRNIIIDEIFPYYRKLLETEMGLMYIRHINKI